MNQINRRKILKGVGLLTGSALLPFPVTGKSIFKTKPEEKPFKKKFLYCLNTSTIRGQKLGIEKEIDLAAKAGYDGMEVWIPVLNEYKAGGKSIKDLGKRISDKGLKVFDAIGFAPWIHEDAQIRAKALDQAKAEMEMVRELGCPRIAAPPAGATDKEISSYDAAAERFRTLIEIGVQQGVIPQLELWGFSKTLYKLSQLLYVAAQCGHPQTRLLTDVFHLYKGGSNPDAMKLIAADAIEIFHMNDHLPSSEMATITDADRVFPGDGSAPLKQLLQDLAKNRDRVILSLELFNPQYYKMDAAEVVTTGLAKLKAAVANAAG